MSSVAPSHFKAEPSERKIQIVVNNDQIFHSDLKKIGLPFLLPPRSDS